MYNFYSILLCTWYNFVKKKNRNSLKQEHCICTVKILYHCIQYSVCPENMITDYDCAVIWAEGLQLVFSGMKSSELRKKRTKKHKKKQNEKKRKTRVICVYFNYCWMLNKKGNVRISYCSLLFWIDQCTHNKVNSKWFPKKISTRG